MNEEMKKKIEEEALRRFPKDCTGTSKWYHDYNEEDRCFFIDSAEYGYNLAKESVNEKLLEALKGLDRFDCTYDGQFLEANGKFVEFDEITEVIHKLFKQSKEK